VKVGDRGRHPSRRCPGWECGLLLVILIVAAWFRLHRLDSVPPGLTHDEASNGHDAAGVLDGICPIYFSVGYGHEPLYPYSVALTMSLLGPTDMALRLTTVGWGMALILLTYDLSRRLFGRLPALLTAAWMASSFWCVMTSRVGLRAITLGTTFTASAVCFWQAFPSLDGELDSRPAPSRHRWTWYVFSGVFLGASIYTYMASRAMPAVYLLFSIYLLALPKLGVRRSSPNPHWTRQWLGIGVLLLAAALVAAPLVYFLVTNPGIEQRITQLSVPLEQAAHGDLRPIWRNVSRTILAFSFRGDPMWRYNIAERPLLDPVSSVFFYLGIVICLARWHDPRYAFLLAWLIVGAAPGLVAGPDATILRLVATQPAVFIIIAEALTTVLQFLHRHARRWGQSVGIGSIVIIVAVITVIGLDTAHDYFTVWGENREVRTTYYHALVRQAHYLDSQPEGGPVTLSSIYPGRFHDPYTMEIALRRDDLVLRWFDGRSALVFPRGEETRVVIPAIAPLNEVLEPILQGHAHHVHTEHLRPNDLIPYFDVFRFDAVGALMASLAAVKDNPAYWSPSHTFRTNQPQAAYEPLALPVDLNGTIELIGYDLRTPSVGPGGEVALLTYWRVRAPCSQEAVVFTHLLDHSGHVVAQIDRLDVPSYYWQPGDAFVQLHRFPVNADASAGLYHLEIGVYTREDPARFPVLVNGVAVDDRVLLSPVEVTSR
jgi:4-amino-4-deoxy-L-arabinose transferase-like glycosyltransferase